MSTTGAAQRHPVQLSKFGAASDRNVVVVCVVVLLLLLLIVDLMMIMMIVYCLHC